jgi:adenylate kinase
LGKEVERIMAAGDLVPDRLIVDTVRQRLPEAEAGRGALLDGFPRTVAQARALDSMLAGEGHKVDFIVALTVPEGVLVGRLLLRAQVEGRTDDNRESIEERMREYHKLTEAVLEHYRKQGVPIHEIDGVGTPDEVFHRIRTGLTGISSREV